MVSAEFRHILSLILILIAIDAMARLFLAKIRLRDFKKNPKDRDKIP